MPVTVKKQFEWDGKPYPTELQAVNAGLEDMGTRLAQQYPKGGKEGLIKYGAEISALWIRYNQIIGGE